MTKVKAKRFDDNILRGERNDEEMDGVDGVFVSHSGGDGSAVLG
jgi:hypothetical protein